jgi:hypothetical protein
MLKWLFWDGKESEGSTGIGSIVTAGAVTGHIGCRPLNQRHGNDNSRPRVAAGAYDNSTGALLGGVVIDVRALVNLPSMGKSISFSRL